jgi:hypothetical protein
MQHGLVHEIIACRPDGDGNRPGIDNMSSSRSLPPLTRRAAKGLVRLALGSHADRIALLFGICIVQAKIRF